MSVVTFGRGSSLRGYVCLWLWVRAFAATTITVLRRDVPRRGEASQRLGQLLPV